MRRKLQRLRLTKDTVLTLAAAGSQQHLPTSACASSCTNSMSPQLCTEALTQCPLAI